MVEASQAIFMNFLSEKENKMRTVEAILTHAGAKRKGYPELSGQIVEAVLGERSEETGNAIEIWHDGKWIFGMATFRSTNNEEPTIRLLE